MSALLVGVGPIAADIAADKLMRHWRSLPEALAASPDCVDHVAGRATAQMLATLSATLQRVTRDAIEDRPLLGSSIQVHAYLMLTLAHRPVEELRVLFLTTGNRLQQDEVMAQGTLGRLGFDARDIIRRALELRSGAMIIAHNHPGGSAEPSAADIRATRALAELAAVFDIVVHDHVVVSRGCCTSLRALGHLR